MHRVLRRTIVGTFTLLTFAAGCQPPAEPITEEPTRRVAFSNVTQTVAEEDIAPAEQSDRVEADFNLDGLMDVALMRLKDGAADEVEIYIRVPPEPSAAGAAPLVQGNRYYKAGVIRREKGTKIVGVASRTRGEYTDLVVLISRSSAANEMIHYLNDGSGFSEVL